MKIINRSIFMVIIHISEYLSVGNCAQVFSDSGHMSIHQSSEGNDSIRSMERLK